MARVIPTEVKKIISVTKKTDLQVEPFITAANLLVTEELAGKGFTNARLKEIERWLAAHFLAIDEDKARVVEVGIGESRRRMGENTRGVLGETLKMTRWGQQAMLLDSSGTLSTLATQKARLTIL